MRPYQITATERILQRIEIAHNYKKAGTLAAGGYIWHTTGSGKTLTSFKTAQLASRLPYVDKVLFVVDRKDLDYQTMKEYDRFEKGAANGNNSVKKLTEQMEDPNCRIIITTIQKLGIFVAKYPKHPVFQQRLVLIFDECHRSQFGDLHAAIVKSFKNYHLFGFTGTPIFAENASASGNPLLKTTEQAFGDKLHTYTIVNAINDGNVLPFRIDYINTVRMADGVRDKQVKAIDVERALAAPERISEVVKYILENFDRKTSRSFFYTVKGQRLAGFNSIFAVSSIPVAMLYYKEFKRQLEELRRDMTVATIFSYQPNEADPEDESFNTADLDETSRDFLEGAIADYNKAFNTNYDTSADKFQNYYKDLSQRMKNREIDLLIVVNMFLTGFDATTLNTLWVDKNLKQHGLIQAFSRTNRILNSVKTFGNIVCFRDLQQETDEAIALFGDKDAGGIVLLKKYEDYYEGFDEEKPSGEPKHHEGYRELIDVLLTRFPLGEPILGEQNEKDFIVLFGSILRVRNILNAFDDFKGNEILTPRQFQDYQSVYLDLYEKHKKPAVDKENINSDIVFEMELMRQVEINIDYILMLVEKFRASHGEDKVILASIRTAINSSIELRSKKELIEGFIEDINVSSSVGEDWKRYVSERKEADLADLIQQERLKPEEARKFIDNAFRDGALKTIGTDIDKIMPPANPFDRKSGEKKKGIIERIKAFFEKYLGLV
ncbi:MAG: type I restriction endonuclease subunit R [Desulfovibrionaceae bacterium]|nr:type I restriction endonuclease subunit R [Desulfovibrionaceae bacterium]